MRSSGRCGCWPRVASCHGCGSPWPTSRPGVRGGLPDDPAPYHRGVPGGRGRSTPSAATGVLVRGSLLGCLVGGLVTVTACDGSTGASGPVPARAAQASPDDQPFAADFTGQGQPTGDQLSSLLDARAAAILRHDSRGVAELADATDSAAQLTYARRLGGVPLRSWSYRVTRPLGQGRFDVRLSYQISGVDAQPVVRERTMTVRSTSSGWRLASDVPTS